MKITKIASGKKAIKMSKSEWESIGKKAGWIKKAGKTFFIEKRKPVGEFPTEQQASDIQNKKESIDQEHSYKIIPTSENNWLLIKYKIIGQISDQQKANEKVEELNNSSKDGYTYNIIEGED